MDDKQPIERILVQRQYVFQFPGMMKRDWQNLPVVLYKFAFGACQNPVSRLLENLAVFYSISEIDEC